jgi:sn-glycerol 3-phosphate transport system permease protein
VAWVAGTPESRMAKHLGPSAGVTGSSARVREALLGYAYLVPAFAVFAVFFFYPLGRLLQLSLYDTRGVFANQRQEFVGLEQWGDVLGSEDFRSSVWITVQYVLFTVPAGIVLGVLLAQLANRRLRGIKLFRTVFSSTVATSVAVASVIFFALVNPEVGYFRNVSWLSWLNTQNPDSALLAVSVSSIWQNLGLTFIIVLAAMQSIPEELLEAATIDGYGAVRRFFRVTLPLLGPTLLFLVVVLVIFAFQAFGQIDILTKGGPQGRTETLVYRIFTIQFDDVNTAAVMSIGLFALTFVITLVQFGMLERRVTYAD